MDPNKFFTPKYGVQPESTQPVQQPQQGPYYGTGQTPPPTGNSPQPTPNKSKKGLIIAAIVGITVALILVIVVVVTLSSNNQNTPKTTTNDSSESQVITPAKSIDLEQTNNSLSQDLSSLDDETDLPNNSLEDSTLGL